MTTTFQMPPIEETITSSPGLIFGALARAQATFDPIPKSKTAKVKSERTGVEYTYDYADIADVLAEVRPKLAAQGIAVVQRTDVLINGGHILVTTLYAEDGSFLESQWKMRDLDKPQDVGGDLTYFRRYQLSALVGVASEDDDDNARSAQRSNYSEDGPAPRRTQVTHTSAARTPVEGNTETTPGERQAFRDWMTTTIKPTALAETMRQFLAANDIDARRKDLTAEQIAVVRAEWDRMNTTDPLDDDDLGTGEPNPPIVDDQVEHPPWDMATDDEIGAAVMSMDEYVIDEWLAFFEAPVVEGNVGAKRAALIPAWMEGRDAAQTAAAPDADPDA